MTLTGGAGRTIFVRRSLINVLVFFFQREAPSRPVTVKPNLVSEDDRLRTEAFLVKFERDYHVCPVGKDLGEFFKEKNIKLTLDEEVPEH